MSQIETTKLVPYINIGADYDEVAVSKLVVYVWATPDSSIIDTTNKQGHVYGRIVRDVG